MTTDHPQEFVDLGHPGPDEAMTATSEPGTHDDWDDTGPIPLPVARPASDSPEPAQKSPVGTPDAPTPTAPVFDRADNTARLALELADLRRTVARMTAARDEWMNALDQFEARAEHAEGQVSTLTAERDEARAEVERLSSVNDASVSLAEFTAERFRGACERAEAAEVEVRDLRAKVAAVEALASFGPVYEGETEDAPYVVHLADLRVALASVGRTEPEGAGDDHA